MEGQRTKELPHLRTLDTGLSRNGKSGQMATARYRREFSRMGLTWL
jgi:hypothetical protein